MKIKEGTLLEIIHTRKGTFKGIATEDFDTKKRTFYPIRLAEGEKVYGASATWIGGDEIPCRDGLCSVKVLKKR